MSSRAPHPARVIPLRPVTASQSAVPRPIPRAPARQVSAPPPAKPAREPLWRDVVGDVLRRERQTQDRTLKDVAEAARISVPYLSELERGRKEASSEVLAAAAHALGLGLADLLTLAQDELARAQGELTPVRREPVRTPGEPARGQDEPARQDPRRPAPAAPTASVRVTARHEVAFTSAHRAAGRPGPGEVRLAAAA